MQIKPAGSTTTLVEGYFTAPAINAGSSSSQSPSLTIPGSAASGTYTAYVILDYNNSGNQSNTNNDISQGNFTVNH